MEIKKCSWCGGFFVEGDNCPFCKGTVYSTINIIDFYDLDWMLHTQNIYKDFGADNGLEEVETYLEEEEVIKFLNEWYEII